MPSTARLRTQTGCFQCRNRRKKCDETRPRCLGCTRNDLGCKWPSGEPSDRRRGMRHRQSPKSLNSVDVSLDSELSLTLTPPIAMPSPFQHEEHSYLYRYFASTVLSRLVRQSSLSHYSDQSYMLRLALEFPPLMGAMISIAGMQLAPAPRWSISCAVQSYVHTITGLRRMLENAEDIGSDDALLATVISLSVFETSRLDSSPNTAPHITASGIILAQRRPRMACPQTAVFDRICIESFVYHASLMMLFDPSLDALSSIRQQLDLPQRFLNFGQGDSAAWEFGISTQPILYAPYKFFLLIADITKLARISRVLDDPEISTWTKIQQELCHWPRVLDTEDELLAAIYGFSVQILLLKSNPNITYDEKSRQAEFNLEAGLEHVPFLNLDHHFASYLLWPLAILGSACTTFEEQKTIQTCISLVSIQKPGGHASWVHRRLRKIWSVVNKTNEKYPAKRRLLGLQALLDGDKEDD